VFHVRLGDMGDPLSEALVCWIFPSKVLGFDIAHSISSKWVVSSSDIVGFLLRTNSSSDSNLGGD